MKKNAPLVLAALLCLSCAGMPEQESEALGTPVSLESIIINIQGYTPPEGEELIADVLYYPANKIFALRFPYGEYTYFQYYNSEVREMYSRSLGRFMNDQSQGVLTAQGLRARQFYGAINGSAAYEHSRYFGSYNSSPVMEFGYLHYNNRTFFSITQEEAYIDGNDENRNFMSYRIPIFFTNNEARKLGYLFGLDPSPIVCFGDTVTSGYSSTRRGIADQARAYPAFLQEKTSIPIINSGGGYESTEQALRRIDRDVLAYNPQMVLIFFGARDFSRQVPWQDTRNNLEEMITRISDGKRKIYIVQFYTPERLASSMRRWEISDDEKEEFVQGYEDMYADFSKMENVEVITDAWDGVWGEHMSSDSSNPVMAGQEIMAENIFYAIKPYLEERNAVKLF